MKGSANIIASLNSVLKNELTVINQYFLHARMHRNWGFEGLNHSAYKASIRTMKEADRLIERILMLEGHPNLQDLGRLKIGETPAECLSSDLAFEINTHRPDLLAGIRLAEAEQDFVTRDILEELLEGSEEYIDYLETQLSLIETISLENYLQSQIEGD